MENIVKLTPTDQPIALAKTNYKQYQKSCQTLFNAVKGVLTTKTASSLSKEERVWCCLAFVNEQKETTEKNVGQLIRVITQLDHWLGDQFVYVYQPQFIDLVCKSVSQQHKTWCALFDEKAPLILGSPKCWKHTRRILAVSDERKKTLEDIAYRCSLYGQTVKTYPLLKDFERHHRVHALAVLADMACLFDLRPEDFKKWKHLSYLSETEFLRLLPDLVRLKGKYFHLYNLRRCTKLLQRFVAEGKDRSAKALIAQAQQVGVIDDLPEKEDEAKVNSLMMAVRRSNPDLLRTILHAYEGDPKKVLINDCHTMAVMEAFDRKNWECMKVLLHLESPEDRAWFANAPFLLRFDEEGDVVVDNSEDFVPSLTAPLLWAVERRSTWLVKHLLGFPEIDCNYQCEENKNRTALHRAVKSRNSGVLQLLLESGKCDHSIKDAKGRTAEDYANKYWKDAINILRKP